MSTKARPSGSATDAAEGCRGNVCDGATLRRALAAAASWLEANAEAVNALNVFPVPDGDTGTNMAATAASAVRDLPDAGEAGETAQQLYRGAMMGARGNSGVILSQIVKGFALGLTEKVTFTPADLSRALNEAAQAAYRGVGKPVEGTILTVIKDVAAAVAEPRPTFAETLSVAVQAAQESVARTPSLLPVLRQAGVVDAGGQGLYYLLEGARRFVQGESLRRSADAEVAAQAGDTRQWIEETDELTYGYCTEFLIEGQGLEREPLHQQLARLGDSLLVVGDESLIRVHVHTYDPGRALSLGVKHGTLARVKIENMQEQRQRWAERYRPAEPAASAPAPAAAAEQAAVGVVAVVSGEGLVALLQSLQVSGLVPGGQTMNPSTAEMLEAVEAAPARAVILLPNNENILAAARQVPELASKPVQIVPTRTIAQGIAALFAFRFDADLGTNVAAMTAAAHLVRTGEVTRAVRDAEVNGVAVREGQTIGLVDGQLVTAGDDETWVIDDLLERLAIDDAEIVTLYHGEGATAESADSLAERIRAAHPALQVEVVDGGQRHYAYILAVE